MQGESKYILGLDLGTASIGAALVRIPSGLVDRKADDTTGITQQIEHLAKDESQAEIIWMGVRRFEEVYDAQKKTETLNKHRRDKRLARRLLRRKRTRKQTVLKLLVQSGLAQALDNPFPDTPKCRFSPYDIWYRAYDEDLTAQEFGKLIALLSHRRGFKSNLGAGIGDLRSIAEIDAYLVAQEVEEMRKAVEQGNKKKNDAGDDEGKTLFQVGNWSDQFAKVPLGKFFWSLLNPGNDGEQLATLAKDPASISKMQRVYERQQIRNKKSNPLWARPDRKAYEVEFHRLWARQAPHLGLNEELRDKLFHAIYFQNPLQFPKDQRAFCSLGKYIDPETGEVKAAHVSPRTNLLYQEYRLRKLLADLKLKEADLAEYRHLTAPEKEKLFGILDSKREVSWSAMGKAIGLPKAIFEPSQRKNKSSDYTNSGMVGNKVGAWFDGLKEDDQTNVELRNLWVAPERFLTKELKEQLKDTDQGKREQVRHRLIRMIGEASYIQTRRNGEPAPRPKMERVYTLIKDEFDLSPLATYRLAEAPFPDGYCSMSYEAMAKMMPYMREGKMEHEARALAFPQTDQAKDQQIVRYFPSPPDAQVILSPRVRKALNQTRRMINALYKEFPDLEIDAIHVELARRLQLNNEQFLADEAFRAYNEKMNTQAEGMWNQRFAGKAVPRWFRTKYRLAVEQGWRCPYSGDDSPTITQQDLFDGTKLEIEHIWPRQYGGDSLANKVLVFREENQKKGGNAPWQMPEEWRKRVADAMSKWPILETKAEKSVSQDEAKKDRLKAPSIAVDIAASRKKKVLTATAPKPNDETFADRQAVETGYIARSAVEYLRPFTRKTVPIKSSFSTEVARMWGFYKRLDHVHADDLDRVPRNKKDRILNRHHAVDALATALSTPKLIHLVVMQRTEAEKAKDAKAQWLEVNPNKEMPSDRDEVKSAWIGKQIKKLQPVGIAKQVEDKLRDIVVTYEKRHDPQGALFKEQPFGLPAGSEPPKDGRCLVTSYVNVKDLKAAQVFEEFEKVKKSAPKEDDDDAGRSGRIASLVTKARIRKALIEAGFGPDRGKDAVQEYIATLENGVPYQAKRGTRWIRRVLLKVQSEPMANYYIREEGGGKTLYPKDGRHCAVVVSNGKKSIMEVIANADALLVSHLSPEDFRLEMIRLAALQSGRGLHEFDGALIIHKNDIVRVRRYGEDEWLPDLYFVTALEGLARRIRVRALWSGDNEQKKDLAIGLLMCVVTVFEFQLVSLNDAGIEVLQE